MRNKNKFYLILSFFFFFSFVVITNKNKLTIDDIRGGLKISNVVFSEEQVNTMLSYVERNRRGYEEMREIKLEQNTMPALTYSLPPKKKRNLVFNLQPDPIELPQNNDDIAFLSISQLAYLIKNKKISSLELTQIYLNRINRLNNKINAMVLLTDSIALTQAKKADEEIQQGNYRGLLHGIPYGIKDLAAFPKHPTTWGAMPLKNQIINNKAEVITRLEKAGAIMLGKLSTGSLARGDVWFGGKTLNPWDLSQGSSGSSAGSASATSAGLVGFSIGTETLGSIISPATRCGVTGLRPTYNSVSTVGFMTLSWSMDKVGPITRSAKGAAIVYNTIKKKNNGLTEVVLGLKKRDEKLKIGYLKNLFTNDTSRYFKNNLETIRLIKKDFKLTPLELPKKYPYSVFYIILRSEAGAFFDDFLLKNLDSSMVEQGERSRANSLRQARLIPAVEYIQANRHRANLIKEVDSLFNQFDVILSPTFGKNQMMITNLTGHPVISIPNGFDKNKRPTSISLIGNYYNEDKILYLANKIQEKTNFHLQKPPGFN